MTRENSGSANSRGNNIHDAKAQTAIHSPAWKTHDYHMGVDGREYINFLACWCEHILLKTFVENPLRSCGRFPSCIEEMGINNRDVKITGRFSVLSKGRL
jgi:hypothetical protein